MGQGSEPGPLGPLAPPICSSCRGARLGAWICGALPATRWKSLEAMGRPRPVPFSAPVSQGPVARGLVRKAHEVRGPYPSTHLIPWAVRPFAVEALGLGLGRPESCPWAVWEAQEGRSPGPEPLHSESGQGWLLGRHPGSGPTLWLGGVPVVDGQGAYLESCPGLGQRAQRQGHPWPGGLPAHRGPHCTSCGGHAALCDLTQLPRSLPRTRDPFYVAPSRPAPACVPSAPRLATPTSKPLPPSPGCSP